MKLSARPAFIHRTVTFLRSTLFAVGIFWLACGSLLFASEPRPKIAVITTVWYQNSHADLIAGRLLEGMTLEGKELPKLQAVSLYVDQFPSNDKSRRLAAKHGLPIYDNIAHALTLGGSTLAVDGILLIAEHGSYPESDTGQIQFPKRRFFAEVVKVFTESERVVPVFFDKHLGDNWDDIAWIRGEVQRLGIPLLAGSSLPLLWRQPSLDVEPDRPLQEIVATSYHRPDSYGFHALEMVQCLAEHRPGGETGVRSVRCLHGEAVWEAGRSGIYDRELLAEAVKCFLRQPLPPNSTIESVVKNPLLFVINYRDGLRASVLTLDGTFAEWSAAWKYHDGAIAATAFETQELRPFQHLGLQLAAVEQWMHKGAPAWPIERTVLTSGMLDALLVSHREHGGVVQTPHLDIQYSSKWRWTPPLPPPAGRPLDEP